MRLSKKYWFALTSKFLLILLTLLSSIIINRGLGVEKKGDYAYVMNLVEIFYILGGVGLGQAYSTFKRNHSNEYQNKFVVLTFIQGLLFGIIGLIIVLADVPIDYGGVIIVLSSLSIMRTNLTMIAVIENSIKRNKIVLGVSVVYSIMLVLLLLFHLVSIEMVFLVYAINEFLRIILFLYYYNMFPIFEHISIKEFFTIYKFGFLSMILTLLITFNYSIDIIMLKQMSSSYNVGIYSVAVTFSNMFLMVPDSFKEVLFGDSAKRTFEKNKAINAIKVSFLFMILLIIEFLSFGEFAITLLYGSSYIKAFPITLVIFLGSLSLIFFKILQPIYISQGKQSVAIKILSVSALINISLNWYLIPNYQITGAAIASAISYTVCGLFFIIDYLRN